ncbi:MAG: ABC transporter ATP-binding protein, partial [Nitrospira sp.]|nr:ABC transporter ATP-binding protein [Nitrospira sp.]
MSSAAWALRIQGLRKTFSVGWWGPPVVALDGLDLAVAPGEVIGLLGPNGAGKSTTFRLLAGLIRPTAGEAWVFDRPIGDPEARRAMGYVPDQPALYDYLTAEESLMLSGQLTGVPPWRLRERVEELLGVVGLQDVRHRRVRTFSKGMLQRVGMAQALVHEPACVLLDEPMSGLDPIGRADMQALLWDLKRRGTTMLVSSHLLHDIAGLCDRVGVVVRGRLVVIGSVQDVFGTLGQCR